MCKRERDGLKNRAEERGASRQGIVLKKKRKTKCVKESKRKTSQSRRGRVGGGAGKGGGPSSEDIVAKDKKNLKKNKN